MHYHMFIVNQLLSLKFFRDNVVCFNFNGIIINSHIKSFLVILVIY